MTKRVVFVTLAAVALGLTATAVADDLTSVEKRITEAWNKHKSMSAKLTQATHVEMGTTVMDMKGEGTLEMTRTGDKILARVELKSTVMSKSGDQENKSEQPMTTIIDGEFAYTVSEAMGQKMAFKNKIDPMMVGEPKATLEQFRKTNELNLLPDETLDGKKVFVIEAGSKDKTAGAGVPSKVVCYFDQESGIMVKMTMLGADDKPMTTVTYTDIKLDPKIDPDRFKFTAPEGVKVIDQTGAAGAPAAHP